MTPERLGSLIGGVFGLVFVLVNAGPLPTGAGIVVRALGILVFLLVLVVVGRARRTPASPVPAGGFGVGYWLVVAAEVIAIVVGVRLLGGPLDTSDAGVAWVAFVVGVHFVALAVVWAQPLFHWLGGSLLLCGAFGLILAFADAPQAAVASIGGVLPGALLLAFALWGATIGGADLDDSRSDQSVGGAD